MLILEYAFIEVTLHEDRDVGSVANIFLKRPCFGGPNIGQGLIIPIVKLTHLQINVQGLLHWFCAIYFYHTNNKMLPISFFDWLEKNSKYGKVEDG